MRVLAWPLACYLAVTVGVPLLHGAPFDAEHAATIAVAVAVFGVAASRLKNFRRLS